MLAKAVEGSVIHCQYKLFQRVFKEVMFLPTNLIEVLFGDLTGSGRDDRLKQRAVIRH